jgi:hypothetical protein
MNCAAPLFFLPDGKDYLVSQYPQVIEMVVRNRAQFLRVAVYVDQAEGLVGGHDRQQDDVAVVVNMLGV